MELAKSNDLEEFQMEELLLPDKITKEWAATGASLTQPESFCQFAINRLWLERYKSVVPDLIMRGYCSGLKKMQLRA